MVPKIVELCGSDRFIPSLRTSRSESHRNLTWGSLEIHSLGHVLTPYLVIYGMSTGSNLKWSLFEGFSK